MKSLSKYILMLCLCLLFVVPTLAQDDATPEPVPTDEPPVVIVETPPVEEPVLEVSGDLARVLVIVAFLGTLAITVYAGIRTQQLSQKLAKFVDNTTSDVPLTTTLEYQFAGLTPDQQAGIKTLIAIVSPLTNLTPGNLDEKTAKWLQEIVDGVPVKDKPVPLYVYDAQHAQG